MTPGSIMRTSSKFSARKNIHISASLPYPCKKQALWNILKMAASKTWRSCTTSYVFYVRRTIVRPYAYFLSPAHDAMYCSLSCSEGAHFQNDILYQPDQKYPRDFEGLCEVNPH